MEVGFFASVTSSADVFISSTAEYLEDGNCKPCHSTCETCNGPTEQACLSCNSPFILQNTKCVAACEKGFYLGANSPMCSTCHHSCSSCTSRRNCTECFSALHVSCSCIRLQHISHYFTVYFSYKTAIVSPLASKVTTATVAFAKNATSVVKAAVVLDKISASPVLLGGS